MDKNRNPKTTKNEKSDYISETEARFDNLLKNQKEEIKNTSKWSGLKLFSIIFLILVICVSLYFAVSFYFNSTGRNLAGTGVETSQNNNSGAYFSPEYYTNRGRSLSGKIQSNTNSNDPERQFLLVDENGENLAYIYSQSNDLSLSIGLDVQVEGELEETTSDGIEVIEVDSIRLK